MEKEQKIRIRIDSFGTKLFGVLQTNNEHYAFMVQVHRNSFISEISKNYDFVFTYTQLIWAVIWQWEFICTHINKCVLSEGRTETNNHFLLFYIFYSSIVHCAFCCKHSNIIIALFTCPLSRICLYLFGVYDYYYCHYSSLSPPLQLS